MQRGTNLGRLGGYNQAVILDTIRRAQDGVARVELVERTGLSPQTISNVVRRLVDQGLVREDRKTVSGPGKPRTVLELEVSSRFAIGIHLDPAVMTVVALNLTGQVVARARHAMPGGPKPDGTVESMAVAVNGLIEEAGLDRARILGVGLAAPGPISLPEGMMVSPPMLPGWDRVPLREPLERLIDLPVLLDKDVTAAVVAELWAGEREAPANFVFIYLGTGLGAGVALGGEVLRGSSGNIGEIGHFPVPDEVPLCGCGRRNCVGMSLNFAGLIRQAIDAGIFPPNHDAQQLPETTAAILELTRLAESGHPEALSILRRAARNLAFAVAQVVNVLDVDTVIFGGPLWDPLSELGLPVLREELPREVVAREIHGLEVVGSSQGPEVGAIGGACLILDDAFSPRASGLLLGN
jgi:predicted NBD/HSP70 family sugar kinase